MRADRILIGTFFFIALAGFISFSMQKPRIFILHSYHPSYSWTRDVDVGLDRVLAEKTYYSVRRFYMDTKRHPWVHYKKAVGVNAYNSINTWKPDVLIAVDDDAQKYVASRFVGNPDIDVVFAGVNGEIDKYGYSKADNVTGILERKKLKALKDMLLILADKHPDHPLRIVNIGDKSESVQYDDDFIKSFDWSPVVYAGSTLVETLGEWKDAISSASRIADVVIVENYRKLVREAGKTDLVPPEETVGWTTKNSSIPVVGLNGFYVEDGGMMSIATSPYEQGEVAADIAVRIVDGTPPSEIPVASTRQFVVYMSKSLVNSSGLELPEVYEAFARGTNNYYE